MKSKQTRQSSPSWCRKILMPMWHLIWVIIKTKIRTMITSILILMLTLNQKFVKLILLDNNNWSVVMMTMNLVAAAIRIFLKATSPVVWWVAWCKVSWTWEVTWSVAWPQACKVTPNLKCLCSNHQCQMFKILNKKLKNRCCSVL